MKLLNSQLHNNPVPLTKEYLGYKIALTSLFYLLEESCFNQENIHKVTHFFEPAIVPDFFEEIYALIPIKKSLYKKTFVLYKDYALYVERPSLEIIRNILWSYQYLDFNVYTRTVRSIFSKSTSIVPIATQNFSLVPLGSMNDKKTIWLNPAHVSKIEETKHQTILTLDNTFSIKSDRQARGIKGRMEKSFIIHGILKREADAGLIRPTTNLLEYLDLPSTDITRIILRGIEYQHLPGLQGDFFTQYDRENAHLAKIKLLQRLDIEE